MVVELKSPNQKKLKQEKKMAEEQYETEVEFYTRYNHGASAMMGKD